MTTRIPFVGGNWKMHTDAASATALARSVADAAGDRADVEIAVFPPFPYLLTVGRTLRDRAPTARVRLGAQDVYFEAEGAFTGEVSAGMLVDCGCSHVLTGHSERRHVMGETDETVNRKALAALAADLEVVLCVGEQLEERERGETDAVNERQIRAGLSEVAREQMSRVTIAYEPVWAIGTGRTATPEDAQTAHGRIRGLLAELYDEGVAGATRVIYGGSVKPGNAVDLLGQPDVDGGLIGGASLDAGGFLEIVRACPARDG